MDYEKRTGYDYSASRFDLCRVRELLARLGDPQNRMLLAHIAGTKGKGSTAVMLASILAQTGERVGLYTSPHLHTVRERVRVSGENVNRELFTQAAEIVAAEVSAVPGITSFEVLTALAFQVFALTDTKVAVLETGMGGRLDATNVITPYVSIITSLSYDHTAILGGTLTAIAGEKAGIIKPGVPVISAPQKPEAEAVLREKAAAMNAPISFCGSDWRYTAGVFDDRQQCFTVTGPRRENPLADGEYQLSLLGTHQLDNATLALAAAEAASGQLPISKEHMQRGLAAASWPSRFEITHRKPYVVLDGAHNADSVEKLVDALQRHLQFRHLYLVFGSGRDKDIYGMLKAFSILKPTIYLCSSKHARAADAQATMELVQSMGLRAEQMPTVAQAFWQAMGVAGKDDCVCVAGSLFVTAEVREAIANRFGIVDTTDDEIDVISLGTWRS